MKQTPNCIPSGNAQTAFKNICADLAKLGVHVVPVGELEGFDRSSGGHGPRWVNEVMEKDLSDDTLFGEAHKFIKAAVFDEA